MMVKGGRKGGSFERECSRDLTEWLTTHLEEEPRRNPPELWRTKGSGGWPWADVHDVLDLAPNGPLGVEFRKRFAVECKHRKDFDLNWSFFTKGLPEVLEWWEKSVLSCEPYPELVPLLLIQKNWYPRLIGYPSGFFQFPEVLSSRRLVMEPAGLEFVEWEVFKEVPVQRVYDVWEERRS